MESVVSILLKNPTIHIPHLPRHIVQLRQPTNGFAHLIQVGETPQHMPLHIIGGRIGVTGQSRCLPPRTHEINPDIVRPPFARRCLHEPYQPSLGGRIGPWPLVPCNPA